MNVYSVNDNVFKTKTFRRFEKYVCKDLNITSKEKTRLYHGRAEATVSSYTNVIKKYVKFSKKSHITPFPVSERNVRLFIDGLDLAKDRSMFRVIKPALVYCKNVRGDPDISFNTMDLVLEGLLREVGNNFKKKPNFDIRSELDVRKFLLRCLYGPKMHAPFNENNLELRTGVRNLTCLFTLGRCADYMMLRKEDFIFEEDSVIISWNKRKNNQRAERQLSIVPKLEDHPLDLYKAIDHYFKATQMKDNQFVNSRLSSRGRAIGEKGISRSYCYSDNNKICAELKLCKISEKACKSIGTR